MGEIDPAFIQEPEHRPNLTASKEAHGIPIIDLSVLSNYHDGNADAIEGLVRDIESACRKWGFFQVINHGVSSELRQRMEAASKKFFDQSSEVKKKVSRDNKSVTGYYDTEHTKNIRDWKEVFDFVVKEPTVVPALHDDSNDDNQVLQYWTNKWPQFVPEFRETSQEYVQEMEKLGYKLLELIALSLGLPAKHFHGFFKDDQTSFLRFNHYPPCPYPDLALGVGRHKDSGALSILAQDHVGGLEVKRKSDGEWIGVNPIPDAFIINLGDIIQVWSNDAYESVEHRVTVNTETDRFSIPFFFNPAHHTIVEPLKELISDQNPPTYVPYNWGHFLISRMASNFKKQDVENLEVYHFKESHTP